MIVEQQTKYISEIINLNQETHRMKHDMRHILSHLNSLLEKGELEECAKYISEYNRDIQRVGNIVFTNNKTINILLNMYREKAKVENIDFYYSKTFDIDISLGNRQLFVLLSNALENAFIHNNNKKMVRVKIDEVQDYQRIIILNTTDVCEITENKKDGHGYGLKSMNQIISECNGNLDIKLENGWFACSMLLPKK